MIAQYARQEEEWVPCSDWGWKQKAENEKYLRELEAAKRGEKKPAPLKLSEEVREQRKKRNREIRKQQYRSRIARYCKCGKGIYASNKCGLCQTCATGGARKALELGPRPKCQKCPALLNRCNKLGVCHKCATSAVRAGRDQFAYQTCACGAKMGNRNKVGKCKACLLAALPPKTYCRECNVLLHPNNRIGLCIRHSGSSQHKYLIRRKAAA